MTPDKALDAVKKAVEQLLPHVEHRKAMMAAYGHDMAAPFDAAQLNVLIAALRAIAPDGPLAVVPRMTTEWKFKLGQYVSKKRGSSWHGLVVGTYSSSLTPHGYAVESLMERGNVQVYPEDALEEWIAEGEKP